AGLLLPVLEQGLDEADTEERVVHIPKVELHIRVGSELELEKLLPGAMLDQLRRQLRLQLTAGGTTAQAPPSEVVTEENSRFEILMQYLRSGTLPWQAADGSAEDQALQLGETCREQWPRILELLKTVREEAPFYFRLLQLLPENEYAMLIRVLSDSIPEEFREPAMECLALLLDGKSERSRHSHYTRLSLMAGVLAESIAWQKKTAARALLKMAASTVPPQERHLLKESIAAMPRPLPEEEADSSGVEDESTPGAGIVEAPHSPDPELQQERRSENRFAASQTDAGSAAAEYNAPPAPIGRNDQTRAEVPEGLYPMLVQQAGLVLLHPFLARFFEISHVKEVGREELRPTSLPRAAALLHLLATGREDLYEYELGLIKILLGLDPETALPVCTGLLNAEDREEAETLLQSAIEHWSALKNTSAGGLRSAFIERHGLLRRDDDGWKLNLERKSYDILLDQLPWSIGIVKLPWMKRAIFAEW
ncbi:MAG: contractile injection system tape measure protein, partial [Pseudomonadota bacterium]